MGLATVFSTKFISGTLVDPSGIMKKFLDPAFFGGKKQLMMLMYIMEF